MTRLPERYELRAIGRVRSSLVEPRDAPRQADEGAPEAWLEFDPDMADALADLRTGAEMVLVTWLHRADREVLQVHPRGDETRPLTGVFSTRSPARPNPIGLHRVTVAAIDGTRVKVSAFEAVDGTPILDLKPVLADVADR